MIEMVRRAQAIVLRTGKISLSVSGTLLLLLLTGCTHTNFTRTGFDTPPALPPGPCTAVVLQQLPPDRKVIEVGICMTSLAGGGVVSDKTPAAIRELQDCACKNGGNAILLQGSGDSGYHSGFGYSQQNVKARGSVLYVLPKAE